MIDAYRRHAQLFNSQIALPDTTGCCAPRTRLVSHVQLATAAIDAPCFVPTPRRKSLMQSAQIKGDRNSRLHSSRLVAHLVHISYRRPRPTNWSAPHAHTHSPRIVLAAYLYVSCLRYPNIFSQHNAARCAIIILLTDRFTFFLLARVHPAGYLASSSAQPAVYPLCSEINKHQKSNWR